MENYFDRRIGNTNRTFSEKKRIVICVDGSTCDVENKNLSNVFKISNLLKDEMNQRVLYVLGRRGKYDRSQITFQDLMRGFEYDVKSVYSFICQNYSYGDEVFLFGYSLGGEVCRILASLITRMGILKKKHLRDLRTIKNNPPSFFVEGSQKSIKFLSLFDCLSLEKLDGGHCFQWLETMTELQLQRIEHIYSAISINELQSAIELSLTKEFRFSLRKIIGKTLFEKYPDQYKQHFFAGFHSDIGGGSFQTYEKDSQVRNIGLSLLVLRWVLLKAETLGLKFDFDCRTLELDHLEKYDLNKILHLSTKDFIGVLSTGLENNFFECHKKWLKYMKPKDYYKVMRKPCFPDQIDESVRILVDFNYYSLCIRGGIVTYEKEELVNALLRSPSFHQFQRKIFFDFSKDLYRSNGIVVYDFARNHLAQENTPQNGLLAVFHEILRNGNLKYGEMIWKGFKN